MCNNKRKGKKMYKVVIIDDEPIIVEGLTRLTPWEKYGCFVAAAAYSGQEGLEVIRKEKPDIVISDISMPGLDGLAMIAALKVEFPDMEISILTGYRDFDYCQQAIRLGVTRFLLKPSNMEEIEEALSIMAENLNKKYASNLLWKEKEADEIVKDQEEQTEEGAAGSFIVKNAIQYIKDHYNEKLTLNKVAEKTYVSQWHLSKLLNKQEGRNFSEILNQIRMEHARELLKNPSYRIADISEMVGFTDVAHFSRVFKKTVGISANEYRNRKI